MGRPERLARNEALFREMNERLEELGRRTGTADSGLDFVCECADESCTERIHLSLPEYEEVRADPTHFAVLPGHEVAVEHVVADRGRYRIVAKDDEAGAVAEDADPRS
ncbi:MAG: hypothetical protein ACXVZ4_05695 [Gaiellaceae bacterium]